MGVLPKVWFIGENPTNMDDFGYPIYRKTPYFMVKKHGFRSRWSRFSQQNQSNELRMLLFQGSTWHTTCWYMLVDNAPVLSQTPQPSTVWSGKDPASFNWSRVFLPPFSGQIIVTPLRPHWNVKEIIPNWFYFGLVNYCNLHSIMYCNGVSDVFQIIFHTGRSFLDTNRSMWTEPTISRVMGVFQEWGYRTSWIVQV